VSIIRVGLAETKDYGSGWEAIFGSKKVSGAAKTTKAPAKKAAPKKAAPKKAAPKKKTATKTVKKKTTTKKA
jgi:hypothetical protein